MRADSHYEAPPWPRLIPIRTVDHCREEPLVVVGRRRRRSGPALRRSRPAQRCTRPASGRRRAHLARSKPARIISNNVNEKHIRTHEVCGEFASRFVHSTLNQIPSESRQWPASRRGVTPAAEATGRRRPGPARVAASSARLALRGPAAGPARPLVRPIALSMRVQRIDSLIRSAR
jgi:hypothetical protein